jgi:hypothetical protein
MLGLQVGLEDVNVIIEPLQALLLNCSDAIHNFAGIEHRLRGCERVGCSGVSLAFYEGEGVGAYTKPLKVRSGELQGDLTANAAYVIDLKHGLLRGMVTLSPISGIGGGSAAAGWAVGFLRGLAMTPSA